MCATVRKAVLLILAGLLLTSVALAQNNRSAVSVTGSDLATCTVPDPCRTFGVAIGKTNAGGEIIVLSSGGYGPFTIDKSVSIISPGGIHAALAPSAGTAILINGSIKVFLRNLWINSLGAAIGIEVVAAQAVHVESCTITGFTADAIRVTSAADTYLSVKDSFLRLNNIGVNLSPTGAVTRMTVDRTRVENNSDGIHLNPVALATVDTVIKESLLTANNNGINVLASGSSSTNVETCVFVHNAGVALSGGGSPARAIRVSQSYISNNGTGVQSNGGDDMRSFGNNRIQANSTDGTFTSTILLR